MRASLWLVVALVACKSHDAATVDAFVVDAYERPPEAPYVDPGPAICMPDPAPPTLSAAVQTGGTRLVPRFIVDADGLAVPWGIHDTLLDVDCVPKKLGYPGDGTRCIPADDDTYLYQDLYGDTNATIPVLLLPADQAPRPGAVAIKSGTTDLELYAVGAQYPGSDYFYMTGISQPMPAGYAMYKLTRLSTNLVALDGSLASLTTNIAAQAWHGADGSQLIGTELCDVVHDVPVSWRYGRLLPPHVDRLFSTTRMKITTCYSSGPSPDLIFPDVHVTGCGAPVLRYVGDAEDTTYHVTEQTGTLFQCTFGDAPPVLSASVQTFLGACNAVPTDAWQLVTTDVIGTGRLRWKRASIDGTSLPTMSHPTFTDTTLDVDCAPSRATDGTIRCLPTANAGFIGYADSGCSQEIIVSSTASPPPFLVTRPFLSRRLLDTAVTVRAVSAARGSVPWYSRSGQNCFLQVAQPTFEIGAVMPPTTFAELTFRDGP